MIKYHKILIKQFVGACIVLAAVCTSAYVIFSWDWRAGTVYVSALVARIGFSMMDGKI